MGCTSLRFVLAFSFLPVIRPAEAVQRSDLAQILNFESQQTAGMPRGWGGGPRETIFEDNQVAHSGKWAARLERDAASAGKFSSITLDIPVDFSGTRIELCGFLKTENVSEFAGLWMREDGDGGAVAFDNMQDR